GANKGFAGSNHNPKVLADIACTFDEQFQFITEIVLLRDLRRDERLENQAGKLALFRGKLHQSERNLTKLALNTHICQRNGDHEIDAFIYLIDWRLKICCEFRVYPFD